MKYSLRSLMIVVTLVCVVLGGVMGRIEYLRRMAAYHDRTASEIVSTLTDQDLLLAANGRASAETNRKVTLMEIHRHQAELFRLTVWHPWTSVTVVVP